MSEATTILLHSPEEVKLNKYQYMPPLPEAAFNDLKEDIAENGILHAVLLDSDQWVIDGHHRIKAWRELLDEGQGPNAVPARVFSDIDEDRARDLSISVNTLTRQFTTDDKDKLARDIFISKAKHFQKIYGTSTDQATNYAPPRVARMVRRSKIATELTMEELIREGEIERPAYYWSKKYNPKTGKTIELRIKVPTRRNTPIVAVVEEAHDLPRVAPPPPALVINDEEIPLGQFEPATTIEDISTGRVALPKYPKKTEEEKAYDELIKLRRRVRVLSPAQVAAIQTDRNQAQSDVGGFSIMTGWVREFTEELRKQAKGRLRLAK